MGGRPIIHFILVVMLVSKSFCAAANCKVLVVVGMPDEADAVQVQTDAVEIIVGTGNVTVLGDKLSSVQLDHIKAVISFGVAGGLNPSYEEGDIVLATEARYRNQGVEADKLLRQFLAQQTRGRGGLVVRDGVYLSEDQWLGLGSEGSSSLYETTRADSTDNESFVAAEFARDNNLPFAGIRAISDGPDVDLPPAALLPLDDDGSPDIWAVLGSVIAEPSQLPDLWALAKRYRNALNQLTIFMSLIDFEVYLQEHYDECR